MTHYLLQSVYGVFEQAFNITINALAKPPTNENVLLYSEIGIIENGKTKKIIIGMPKKGLIALRHIYFGHEDNFSDYELEDCLKELSNLIVGKVKSTFSNNNQDAQLEIPKILSSANLDDYMKKYFKVQDSYIVVAY